ncbi:hypothetical protein ACWC4J_28680 [Streptomyces sp. NPDC001356]
MGIGIRAPCHPHAEDFVTLPLGRRSFHTRVGATAAALSGADGGTAHAARRTARTAHRRAAAVRPFPSPR